MCLSINSAKYSYELYGTYKGRILSFYLPNALLHIYVVHVLERQQGGMVLLDQMESD